MWLLANLSAEDHEAIRSTSREDLVLLHMGVGATIRAMLNLWSKSPLNSASGISHPDDLSIELVKSLWDVLQDAN